MSSSILDLITSKLGGGDLAAISKQLGASEGDTKSAISAALPVLLGAVARNGSTPEGASKLNAALERDHDGSLLDNLGSLFGGNDGGKAMDGAGILKHVLGGKMGAVQNGVAQSGGLNSGQAGDLLSMLAPMVMGALGKKKQQEGLDAGGLGDLLGKERATVEKSAGAGILGSLLDQDGDGDVDLGDIAKGFGKFFG